MYDRILIRFGDLTLKGKNQGDFIRQLYKMLDEKLQGLPITIEKKHDHAYVLLNGYDYNEVMGVPITFLDKYNPTWYQLLK